MNLVHSPRIVVLGMMSKIPVAGAVWQTIHYLEGFRRLGFDVYYVEAHGRTPSMLLERADEDSSLKAASFIARVLERFGMGERWAFHALHDDGRCFGLTEAQLRELYRTADLIINLHGGTVPLPEHGQTERLIYLETDPVELQIELFHQDRQAIEFTASHGAFFTWGLNYGNSECLVPIPDDMVFHPSPPPVIMDFWSSDDRLGHVFRTVGNWRQEWRNLVFNNETYLWSKHHEFLKFVDLPMRTPQRFELALSSYEEGDRQRLVQNGWRVRSALEMSWDLDSYRQYIIGSRGEFTVAKDQNIRLRSGWFSERSAAYLAAGRPVINQNTGFDRYLPTGEGLFSFGAMEDILEAVDRINSDPGRHGRAAREIARAYLSYDVVLPELLAQVPREVPNFPRTTTMQREAFPLDIVLEPLARRPLRLPHETVRTVLSKPAQPPPHGLAIDPASVRRPGHPPQVSIVVLTHDNLVFTRLCLESLLRNTLDVDFDVLVVDNASSDGTVDYLQKLAKSDTRVRLILNEQNLGFPSANNQGLAQAEGDHLVLLNNDTIVPPGWLTGLQRHLRDPGIGLVGPVTNRCGNEAQIEVPYRTYGRFLQFAEYVSAANEGRHFDIRTLNMFCMAMRREIFEEIGPLDQRYGMGLFEDDDYSLRVRMAGYRVVCAEDVFVHHFGEATFGNLAASGEYARLLEANHRRFEEKWELRWEPYARRHGPRYEPMTERLRSVVDTAIPPDSTVLVVSKGDEGLMRLGRRRAWHFPMDGEGGYAGWYPANGEDALGHLHFLHGRGAGYIVFPATALWWLDHYPELSRYLADRCAVLHRDPETCVVFELPTLTEGSKTSAVAEGAA